MAVDNSPGPSHILSILNIFKGDTFLDLSDFRISGERRYDICKEKNTNFPSTLISAVGQQSHAFEDQGSSNLPASIR